MKVNAFSHVMLPLFSICFFLLSCSQGEEKAKEAIAVRDAANGKPPLIELTEPKLNASGKTDTSLLKCYINTYALPYVVKIDNLYYEVKGNELPAFISSQKNELKKYRIHLLTPKNASYKKTIDLPDILTKNDIIDFEEVVDGVLQK